MVKVKRPALQYFGGKWLLAPWIISHFPPHVCYCEPFAGGASVLLRKPPSEIEVYNDLDSAVFTFFRVLRDRPDELIRAIELTPYSYQESREAYETSDDELELARRIAILCNQNHFGQLARQTGWRYAVTGKESTTRTWSQLPVNLAAIASRLKRVQVDNRPALETIARYDTPSTLFYVDPPYVLETRPGSSNGYKEETTDDDHKQLASALNSIRGMVVLSGYDGELYNGLYSGWRKITKNINTFRLDDGVSFALARTEVLWLSPNIQQIQLTLDLE